MGLQLKRVNTNKTKHSKLINTEIGKQNLKHFYYFLSNKITKVIQIST